MLLKVSVCLILLAASCRATTMTKCQQRRAADTEKCGGRLGCYITQCNADGSFKPRQFWEGSTWCVGSQGNKIAGTERGPGQDATNCESTMTKCQQRRAADIAKCGGAIGCYITQCYVDGSFMSSQRWGSTGYTWCVDSQGNKIAGTETGPGQHVAICAWTSTCQLRRAVETEECGGWGCFISQCNADGSFKTSQFWEGYTWCVDIQGNKIADTETGPGQPDAICPPFSSG